MQLLDQPLIQRMQGFATAGGNLVLTCRTGLMDRNGQLWEGSIAKPILSLIGARIEAYDSLPEGAAGTVELIDGGKHSWNVWGDLLYAEEGTKVLAKYTDQFYAGAVAATQLKHGEGAVTYSGVYADQPYYDSLMEKLAGQAKLKITALVDRVCVYRRGKYTVCLNYNDKAVTAPAPKGAKFVVGSTKIEPAGVAVWE
jgi:beta-galactosidase